MFITLFFYSCELGGSGEGGFPATPQFKTFNAIDFSNNTLYEVRAQLLYEGARINVWAEVAANVSPTTARTIANTYDNTIFPRMINVFSDGGIFVSNGQIVARNLMELADFLGDGDGKLAVLLLDIKDNFGVDGNNSFVAGYFWGVDLLDIPGSNRKDMIYLDTNPGLRLGLTEVFHVLAHEMQHLMNFVFSAAIRGQLMDLWIDEGLSESTAWIWSREHNQSRINWFNADPAGTIVRGNNFFVWGNHTAGNPTAVLDDYATAYLFFQWLRLQAGGTGFFSDIIFSRHADHRAVTTAANAAIPGRGYDDWSTLLRTWLAANYVNAPSGPYGYMNDPTLRNIRPRYLTGTAGSHPLYPGEGVYTQRTTMPNATTHIRYAGLPARRSTASTTRDTTGFSTLLSYNVDTRQDGSSSPATPFSMETAQPQASANAVSGNLPQRNLLFEPFSVGARDFFRQKEHEESLFDFDFTRLRMGN